MNTDTHICAPKRTSHTKTIAVIASAVILFCLTTSGPAFGQVAVGDTVAAVPQMPVSFDVRQNDQLAGLDSVQVVVVSQPVHGTLTREGRRLIYESMPGFVGRDSLTYRLSVVPVATMQVDSLASTVTFGASLAIPNIGSSTDQTTFPVSGTITPVLWPGTAPYDSVSVAGLDIRNAAAAALAFDYGDLGVTVLTVNVAVDQGGIVLSQLSPGPTAEPGFAGLFTQAANELGVAGSVQISGSGALGSQVPAGTQVFDTSTTSDLSGLALAAGDSSMVIVNLDLQQQVDLSGNAADLHIRGEIVARGRVPAAVTSNLAKVVIDVVSGLSTDVPHASDWSLYPNPTRGAVWFEGPYDRLEVFDLLGRRVALETSPGGRHALDLSARSAGLYFVRWEAGGRGHARTLIVRR